MENWLGSFLKQIQGWNTVQESYFCDLEYEPLMLHCGKRVPTPNNDINCVDKRSWSGGIISIPRIILRSPPIYAGTQNMMDRIAATLPRPLIYRPAEKFAPEAARRANFFLRLRGGGNLSKRCANFPAGRYTVFYLQATVLDKKACSGSDN